MRADESVSCAIIYNRCDSWEGIGSEHMECAGKPDAKKPKAAMAAEGFF